MPAMPVTTVQKIRERDHHLDQLDEAITEQLHVECD